MSLRIPCALLLGAILLSSCDNEEAATLASGSPYIPSSAPVLQAPDTHTMVMKTDTLAKRIKRTVKPKDITLKEVLRDKRFNPMAVKLFVSLADKTGGASYFAKNSKTVAETIVRILDKHTREKTDIVLLIDKTGSMDDDIDDVQKSVKAIVKELKKFKNIHLGWAAYGDKNVDGAAWYERTPLSADLDNSLTAISSLKVTGGGDLPESVNDALWKTIDETNWRPDARKMMLVIGDAPSLEPPNAEHSLNDVVKKCIASAIHVNLYPVVISTENIYGELEGAEKAAPEDKMVDEKKTTKVEPISHMITKVYPNPTVDLAYLDFSGIGPYTIEVKSLLGKTVASYNTPENKYTLSLLNQPAGIYLVTVYDQTTHKTEVRQVVKN